MGRNKKITPSRLKTIKKARIAVAKRNYDYKHPVVQKTPTEEVIPE